MLKKLWWWLLDEWCAAESYSWHGDFMIEVKDGLPYVVPFCPTVFLNKLKDVS